MNEVEQAQKKFKELKTYIPFLENFLRLLSKKSNVEQIKYDKHEKLLKFLQSNPSR